MRLGPRESVTILRPGEPTGVYDDDTGAEIIGPDSEIPSAGWRVAPRSSEETALNYGQAVVTGLTIYNRAQVDVRASDRLRCRDEVWAVDGDVADWFNGVVVNLKRGS